MRTVLLTLAIVLMAGVCMAADLESTDSNTTVDKIASTSGSWGASALPTIYRITDSKTGQVCYAGISEQKVGKYYVNSVNTISCMPIPK